MDAASGLCLGCWRTLDEITRWSRCTERQRAKILSAINQRRSAAQAPSHAPKR
jgi:hypothetical protein